MIVIFKADEEFLNTFVVPAAIATVYLEEAYVLLRGCCYFSKFTLHEIHKMVKSG